VCLVLQIYTIDGKIKNVVKYILYLYMVRTETISA